MEKKEKGVDFAITKTARRERERERTNRHDITLISSAHATPPPRRHKSASHKKYPIPPLA